MKTRIFYFLFITTLFMSLVSCSDNNKKADKNGKFITEETMKNVIDTLSGLYPSDKDRIERSVKQVADLWISEDGTNEEFAYFCKNNFAPSADKRTALLIKIEDNLEKIFGNNLKLSMELTEPLHMDTGELDDIDLMFGSLDPSAHVNDDLFISKIAFVTILNFPNYTLDEKNKLSEKWSRFDWAAARLGDVFTSRVPAEVNVKVTKTNSESEQYIADYNIYMGNVVDDKSEKLFPEDMKLITHWGLRDELKSNYALGQEGLKKQVMIYDVMKRIIDQSIPTEIINSDKYTWNPSSNKVYKDATDVSFKSEGGKRYQMLKNSFDAARELDKYYPNADNAITRAFDGGLELSQKELEDLFIKLVSSDEVKRTGKLISSKLGRELQPFDIWYDGFKSRTGIPEAELTKIISKKYPTAAYFEKDIPNILRKLGYKPEKADEICKYIRVDASRGAGHAWGSLMKSEKSRLRTRVGKNGMDYKGYNIAVHELGHNVEQTISLHDVDYYILNGVPNTGFTEALAFLFQSRDIDLLGLSESNTEKQYLDALDKLWSCYEIMGVSLVDMQVWQWMYAKKDFTVQQLQDAVISIAKDVWNKYYAPVFGMKDEPILAVYSHMINAPLYLSAYPVGQLIEFQINNYVSDKNFADESVRMFSQGKLTPQVWMKNAVGEEISITPTLKAADAALDKFGY